MLAKAIQRNVQVSAKKATLVCRLIRNKPLPVALRILQNQPQKTAKYLLKLVSSAASNAINNHAMEGDKLYVFHSVANQSASIKRSSPRAKGRTDVIVKRRSHLVVVLSDDPLAKEKINYVRLKPRAHQHKYKDKQLKESTLIKPKKVFNARQEAKK